MTWHQGEAEGRSCEANEKQKAEVVKLPRDLVLQEVETECKWGYGNEKKQHEVEVRTQICTLENNKHASRMKATNIFFIKWRLLIFSACISYFWSIIYFEHNYLRI